jgi:hypothetical protein
VKKFAILDQKGSILLEKDREHRIIMERNIGECKKSNSEGVKGLEAEKRKREQWEEQ